MNGWLAPVKNILKQFSNSCSPDVAKQFKTLLSAANTAIAQMLTGPADAVRLNI